jgi:hypothetical protein
MAFRLSRPSLHFGKERMIQGCLRCNATRWVVLQHLIQQVDSAGIQGGYQTGQSSTWWWIGWKLIGRIIWQLDNARIILCRYRGSQQSKDAIQLIRFRSSSYQGSTRITKEDGWSNEQETTARQLAKTPPNHCMYVQTTQPNPTQAPSSFHSCSHLPFAISAKMHPTLQISTGVEYLRLPNKTSGARYHKVTTSCV